MQVLEDDRYCFACGPNNPVGLHMKVDYEPDKAHCRIVLPKEYQGWVNVVHGGVLATLLDEIMAHAVLKHAGEGVTARLNIRFRAAAEVGIPLDVSGWIEKRKKRVIEAGAEIRRASDRMLVAEAESRFLLREPALPSNET